jgi:hypothetical protein
MKPLSNLAMVMILLTSISLAVAPLANAAEDGSEPAPPVVNEVIRVESKIYSDGDLVASPIVELVPGIVGEVTVSSLEGTPLTILFGTTAVLRTKDGIPYVNLEVSATQAGGVGRGQLNATSIGLALGQEGNVDVSSADQSAFRLAVVATSRRPTLDELAKVRACEDRSLLRLADETISEETQGSCCSVGCANNPEVTLTCCDVISCCDGVCGSCCSP